MQEKFPVLGFDIGGTKIAVSLVTSDGELISSTRVDNKDRDPQDVLPELVAAGKKLLYDAKMPAGQLRAIGIGSPSPMDFDKGIILQPNNMKKWKHVEIRDYLAKEFGVQAFFDNDANAGGLAEWLFGAGQGTQDMIYLTMSTGIGAGIIVSGKLLCGKTHFGGEVGHTVIDINGPRCSCGLIGCYEAFCGGKAIAGRLQKELANEPDSPIVKAAGGNPANIDMKALYLAVKEGDSYANRVWDEMIERNAQAMGLLINTFNPEIIALGTIAIHCEDLFMPALRQRIVKYAWPYTLKACTLMPSKLGARMGELSGAAVALYFLYERGEWQLPWQQKA